LTSKPQSNTFIKSATNPNRKESNVTTQIKHYPRRRLTIACTINGNYATIAAARSDAKDAYNPVRGEEIALGRLFSPKAFIRGRWNLRIRTDDYTNSHGEILWDYLLARLGKSDQTRLFEGKALDADGKFRRDLLFKRTTLPAWKKIYEARS
jgi:hypothetical protein